VIDNCYGVTGGPWFTAGGTSVAAPIVAGLYALAGNAGSVRYAAHGCTTT
jgi:subtilase family serine protease